MKVFTSIALLLSLLVSGTGAAAGSSANTFDKSFKQAYDGDIKELQKNISKLDINQQNTKGETLAMSAASGGQVEVLNLILTKKPNLDLKSKDESTALYYAISNEQSAAAKILIEAGAKLTDIGGNSDTALILATSMNDDALMDILIKRDKSLVNAANSSGETPLMKSARFGNKKTLKMLLDAGANKNAKNKLGKTALDIGKKAQNEDAIKLLSSKK